MTTPRSLAHLTAALLIGLACAQSATADPRYKDGVSGIELQELAQTSMQAANVAGQVTISSRRAYPPCAQAPVITPQKGKWSMLRVSCMGKSSWTRHVRTTIKSRHALPRTSADAPKTGPVVAVLTRSLRRDTVITASDFEMRAISATASIAGFSNPADVIGQRLSKNLAEGRPIQARHLQKNYMIGQDMPVAIQFTGGGLSISTPGLSLENGELGDYIEVRNLSSGLVLKGRVAGPQKITVQAKTH